MKSKFIITRDKIAHMLERRTHSRQSTTIWLLLLLLTVFAWQCKKDDYKGETKGVCPEVVSTIPAMDTTNVLVRTKVTVLFNEAMNPSTINATTFSIVKSTTAIADTKAASTPLLGTITYSGMTATLTFDSPLEPATKYTGTISKGAQDPDGNALKTDYIWSFTTAPLYAVVVSSNPLLSGITTGGGSFNYGDSITVSAVPNAGFTFSNWTDGATVVSPKAIYKFKLGANKTLVANYSAIPYTVAISSLPLASGTTTGAGIFNSGASLTVTAVPSAGFAFTSWTEGTTVVSTDASYLFTLTGNKTLVANFTATPYTVSVSSLPVIGGTTTGTGVFNSGASVTVKAVPNVGYTFINWKEGSVIASTNATYTFTISSNRTLVANYTLASATQYTLALSPLPLLGGTTTGAGTFNSGASVTATAVKSVGYTFTNWKEGANIVSTNAIYTFPIAGNRTLVANFTIIPANNFSLDVIAVNGSVLPNPNQPTYLQGASVVLTATPDPGYSFTSWGGDANGSVNPLTVVMNADKNITANFTQNPVVSPAPINLGGAADFSALTKSGVSTIGVTSVEGNIGVSPASATAITGFGLIMNSDNQSSHTPIVSGLVYASDYATPTPAKMTAAVADMETAFTTAMGLTTPAPIVDLYTGNISGRTLSAGLYKWSTGLLVTNAGVTLQGGPNDVWVFQIEQNLTIDNSAIITLLGGAQAKNIFWVVKGQATLGSNSDFSGIILSKTLISLNTGAKVTGRLLAQTAVTFNTSTVVLP